MSVCQFIRPEYILTVPHKVAICTEDDPNFSFVDNSENFEKISEKNTALYLSAKVDLPLPGRPLMMTRTL